MSAAPAPAATGAGSFDANAVTDSVIRELRRQQDAARELLDHDVAPANHRDGAPTPSVDSDSDSDSDSGDDEDADGRDDASASLRFSGSPHVRGDWRASGYRRGVGGALARADGRLHGRCCRRARGVGVLRRARVRQMASRSLSCGARRGRLGQLALRGLATPGTRGATCRRSWMTTRSIGA